MQVLLSLFILWCIAPGQPLSYPVFGTKRYHRAAGSSYLPSSYATSPYYNSQPQQQQQQYYEQRQPQYYSPNYEQQAYVNENGYYYYPRHEYHSYGMPTYHGEYKPSPYYYAPGPSYSYYDDRDVPSNPLDDLHEEMLQEDERERQREMIPADQEGWYENSRQQDDLTNNFLRNLIAYNREVDAQRHQQQPQPHQDTQNFQRDSPPEYEDYADMPTEYEYDPQDDGYVDMRKYENQHHHHQNDDSSKYLEVEDENERQLKSLARERQHSPAGHHPEESVRDEDSYNNWQHPSSSYASYDADPEYDDTWINWDRKRSRQERLPKRDESITDFNDRKIFPFMKHVEKIEATVKPMIASTVSTATPKPSISSATTTSQPPKSGGAQVGQKEIVLLRPANPAQHIFTPPVMDMIGNALRTGKEESGEVVDEESKRGADSAKSGNVYDTIKELIAMQEHLGHSSKGSTFQKRFVSNEESLVHELDNLKRRSQ